MASLSFDVIWRDRGAAAGLKNLGANADQAHGRLSKFSGMAGKGFKAVGAAAIGMAAVGGAALIGAGVAATAFGIKSVQMAGKFETSMRQVGVVTGVGKKGMKDLTAVAIDMGAKTSFSAQGASEAMLALAKGGMSAAQIKAGALQQTLTLASAGGLELGDAADFMVRGLNSFGLKAGDASRVAAALAGGANASTASVESMGQALSQTATQARTAGLSIEDTVAALAAFDNAGIKGSDAGTSLKTMLQRLVPSTKAAKDQFKELGLITADGSNKFFDAEGNIKSITAVSGILQNALKGQTKEQKLATLATMFGSDASRAAAVLADQGAKGLAKYVKATNDKAAAENLAKSATQGYAGAMERFKGSIETAQIQVGTKLLPSVTSFVNFLSSKGIPALTRMGSDLGPAFSVGLKTLGSLGKVGVGAFKAFAQGMSGGTASFKSFSSFVVTHQADILSSLISGGKAALMFGRTLAIAASAGLRGFAFLLDGVTTATQGILAAIGGIAAGAAFAFGWIPGIGPKLKGAVLAFNSFSKNAVEGARRAADGARGLADGIDKKVIPAIDQASVALTVFGNKEIVKAKQRDQVATLSQLLKQIPKEKRATILTIAKKKGIEEAIKAAKRVKDKTARLKYESNAKKVAAQANRDAKKARDRALVLKYGTNAKKTKDLANRESNKAQNRNRRMLYSTNAKKTRELANRESNKAQNRSRNIKYGTNASIARNKANSDSAKAQNRSRNIHYDHNAASAARGASAAAAHARNITRYITYIKKGGKAYGGKAGDFLGFADGGSPRISGRVNRGSYAERADDVDVALSRDEWVIQKSSARKYGDAKMAAVNAGTARIEYALGGRPGGRADLVSAARGGGGVTVVNNYTVNAEHYVGDKRDLVKALVDLQRQNQLAKVLKR